MARRKKASSDRKYRYIQSTISDETLYNFLYEKYKGKWIVLFYEHRKLIEENENLRRSYNALLDLIDSIKEQLNHELNRIHETVGSIKALVSNTRNQVKEADEIIKKASESVKAIESSTSYIEDIVNKELEEAHVKNQKFRRFILLLLRTKAGMSPDDVENIINRILKAEADYELLDIIDEILGIIRIAHSVEATGVEINGNDSSE